MILSIGCGNYVRSHSHIFVCSEGLARDNRYEYLVSLKVSLIKDALIYFVILKNKNSGVHTFCVFFMQDGNPGLSTYSSNNP